MSVFDTGILIAGASDGGLIRAFRYKSSRGGIHRAKTEPESIWPGSRQEERLPRYAADLESEMIHIRRRLEMYHKKEKEYRIARKIAGIFNLTTLQDKRESDERFLHKLEQANVICYT